MKAVGDPAQGMRAGSGMLAKTPPRCTGNPSSHAVPQPPSVVSAAPLPLRPNDQSQGLPSPPVPSPGSALKSVVLQLRKTKSTPFLGSDRPPPCLIKNGPCSPLSLPHPQASAAARVGPSVPNDSAPYAAAHSASLIERKDLYNLPPAPPTTTHGLSHEGLTSSGPTFPSPAPSALPRQPDAWIPPRLQDRSPERPSTEKNAFNKADQPNVGTHGGTGDGDPVNSSILPERVLQRAASMGASKTAGLASPRDLSWSRGTLARSSESSATQPSHGTPAVTPGSPLASLKAPLGPNASIAAAAPEKFKRGSPDPSCTGSTPPLMRQALPTQAALGTALSKAGNSNMPACQPFSPQASCARGTGCLDNPSISLPLQPRASSSTALSSNPAISLTLQPQTSTCGAINETPPEHSELGPSSSPSNTCPDARVSNGNVLPKAPPSPTWESEGADGKQDDGGALPHAPQSGGAARRLALSNIAIPSDEGVATPRCEPNAPKAYPTTPAPGGSIRGSSVPASPADFHRASSPGAAACAETFDAKNSGRRYPPTPGRSEGAPSRTPTRVADKEGPLSSLHDNVAVRKISFEAPRPAVLDDGGDDGAGAGRPHHRAPSPLGVGSRGAEELVSMETQQHREASQKSIQWVIDRDSSGFDCMPEQDSGSDPLKAQGVKGGSRLSGSRAGPGAAAPMGTLQDAESEESLLAIAKELVEGQLAAIPDGPAHVALRKQLQSARVEAEQALAKAEALEGSSQMLAARAEELSASAIALEAQADAVRRSGHRDQAAVLMKSAPHQLLNTGTSFVMSSSAPCEFL